MDILTLLVVIFVIGILFSAFETAFTAFDRILIETWKRGGRRGIGLLEFLSAHPDRFLSTTLIGNNLSNVAYTAVLVAYCERLGLLGWETTVISAISAVVVLVFSEILPKQLAYATANRIVRVVSVPLFICYVAFSPIRWLLMPLFKLTAKRGEIDADTALLHYQAEIEQVLTGAEATGAVTAEEGEILSRFLDARELKVRQIMTPRTQMIAVDVKDSVEAVREKFQKAGYNRFPVYDGDLDHIIGFIRARDFLDTPASIRAVLRPLHAVPESKLITELLEEFRTRHERIAIVIDEYGGTDGLVTLKDIFHEIVGPVAERWDPIQPVIKRTAPGKFLVSGSAFLEDIEEQTGWEAPSSEANTLSGLMSEELGRIPEAGEEVSINAATFRVIRRNPKRIEGCLMKLSKIHEERDEESA